MDDIYDLRSIFLGKDSLVHTLITDGLEGTPLEESSADLAFLAGTFAVVNIVFLMLFFSQFAILWIERKAVARMNDRRGRPPLFARYGSAKTALLQVNGGRCYLLAEG